MRRRRRWPGRLSVGADEGIWVWVEPARPGVHFQVHDDPELDITGAWQVHEQGLVLVEVCVTSRHPDPEIRSGGGLSSLVQGLAGPTEPPRHLTGSVLRSLSVPELERRTRAALKRGTEDEEELEQATEEAGRQGLDLLALYQVPRVARDLARSLGEESFRPGRQGYPIGLYEWIASEYLRLVRSGSRKILHDLAERASERLDRTVSVSNVRDWVHRARELRMLSRGIQGKAHAEPGPALRPELP